MKKQLLILVAVIGLGFSANAQDEKKSGSGMSGEVKFGPKAGLNIASLTEDNTKSLTGFHVGGFAEIMISDKFAVQPEVLYSMQGAKADEGDGKINLDYIAIPVMAKYFVAEGFSIEAGPQISFVTRAEMSGGGETVDVKDFTNSTDFGLNFGLGYSLPMGVMFSGRYNLGLSDTAKDNEGDAVKNGVFQLSVGYKF